jgi:mRNA interferase MazF
VKRYEIRLASLDPTQIGETMKTRPVVIVSLDAINERLQTITVCPVTAQLHPTWRSRLSVRLGRRDAEIAVDQIRTINKARLGKKIALLPEKDAGALRRLITEMYGE